MGDHIAARRLFRHSLTLEPADWAAWANLATAQFMQRDFQAAKRAADRASRIDPSAPQSWLRVSMAIGELQQPAPALQAVRRSVALDPGMTEAWSTIGYFHRRSRQWDQALTALERALGIGSEQASAWNDLGLVCQALGDWPRSKGAFGRAVVLDGDLAEARANLANFLIHEGNFTDGLKAYRQALTLAPGLANAHVALGAALKDQVLAAPALTAIDRGLAIDPFDIIGHKNRLVTLLHLPDETPDRLYQAHRRFGRRFETAAMKAPRSRPRSAGGPVRLAIATSDLRAHPNARFLRGLFLHRNADRVWISVFSDSAPEDATTGWFRERADLWVPIHGLDDAAVARSIRSQQSDLLVITAAHFDSNRPLLALHHAAPTQVSFLDAATSGLEAMDYWLTDPVLHPEDTRERFTERLFRIPCLYNIPPPGADPAVATSPATEPGAVRFGCFVSPARISEATLQAWGSILRMLPRSSLMLKHRTAYGSTTLRTHLQAGLAALGVAPERTMLLSSDDDRPTHQARYAAIDIALDTFPFTGASTSFDALWMGVPVITLAGATFVQRMTTAILTFAGLEELVAPDLSGYVERAVRLAQNLPRLNGLRASLRERLARSLLCNTVAHAEALEQAFTEMATAR